LPVVQKRHDDLKNSKRENSDREMQKSNPKLTSDDWHEPAK